MLPFFLVSFSFIAPHLRKKEIGTGEFQPVEHVYLVSSFQATCQRFIAEKPMEEVVDPLTHIPEKLIGSQILASEFFLALAQRKEEIYEDHFVN